MSPPSTRTQIIEAADRLFYQQGFDHTSFSHIAAAVNISRGNFYHHFKSKDELLDAVIGSRLIATQAMLETWESSGHNPAERLHSFINMLIVNQDPISHYGCPVGTLCTELAKLDHRALDGANQLFLLFRTWLRRQFEALGHDGNADRLAMHLLARSQGIATIASAFHDQSFIEQEVEQLYRWLETHSGDGH